MGGVRLRAMIVLIVLAATLAGCSFGTNLSRAIRGMQKLVAINQDFVYPIGVAANTSHAFVLDPREDGVSAVIKSVLIDSHEATTIVGTVELPVTRTHNSYSGAAMILEDTLLYVAYEDLFVIDVTNPATPTVVGSYSGSHEYRELGLDPASKIAVLAPGFQLLDVTDPGAIVELGSLPDIGDVDGFGVAIDGSTVYAVAAGNVFVVDITNPAVPTVVNGTGYSAASPYTDVSVPEANTLLAVGLQQGLDVLDTTDPTSIELISHVEGKFYWVPGKGLEEDRGTPFVGYTNDVGTTCPGLVTLYDLQAPSLTTYNVPGELTGRPMGMAVSGSRVVVPYLFLGLAVFRQ